MSRVSAPDYPYAVVPELPAEPMVDVRAFLPGDGPLEIEIGPGRGAFLFERATTSTQARLLGIEVRRKWASLVDQKLKRLGFGERARVVCHDARHALARLGPDGSVSVFFLHFPDPWWKKRHEKRLVLGDALLSAVGRLLADRAEIFVQTDVAERAAEYEARLRACSELEPAGDEPGSARLVANPYGAESNREKRVQADGLPVYRLRFVRVARGAATSGS